MRKRDENRIKLLYFLIISLVFSWFYFHLQKSGNYPFSFDKYFHILTARFYLHNWFSTFDFIDGETDLSTYPPLGHQLLALFSFLFGYENAYAILTVVSLITASYYFSKFVVSHLGYDKKLEIFLFPTILFSTPLLVTSITFGQFTTILSFAFFSISLYYLSLFFRKGDEKCFILSILFAILVFFTNVMVSIVYLITVFLLSTPFIKDLFAMMKNNLVFFMLSVLFVLLIYIPFIKSSFSRDSIPCEIPHWSRYPFNRENIDRYITFFGPSLVGLFPLMYFLIRKKDNYWMSMILSTVFIFSLTIGIYSFSSKIFFSYARWITYERFMLVSSVFLYSLFFVLVYELSNENSFALFIIVCLLILSSVRFFDHNYKLFFDKNADRVFEYKNEVVLKLSKSFSDDYRYAILGYELPVSYIQYTVNKPFVDTDYFTGRTYDTIRNSCSEQIASMKNITALRIFLNKSSDISLKYVISFDRNYDRILNSTGFVKRFDESSGIYVALWVNPNAKPIEYNTHSYNIYSIFRGLIPISILVITLVAYFKFSLNNMVKSNNI